jgi:hypothetical protein
MALGRPALLSGSGVVDAGERPEPDLQQSRLGRRLFGVISRRSRGPRRVRSSRRLHWFYPSVTEVKSLATIRLPS